MARKKGVTTEETRRALLDAAGAVFARKGFDAASIADIATEAGVTSGSIYSHFGSKAGLLAATLADVFDDSPVHQAASSANDSVLGYLSFVGAAMSKANEQEVSLMLEATVAAKRDPEVAQMVSEWLSAGEVELADELRAGQDAGLVDSTASPEAIARLTTMLALGWYLVSASEVEPVDPDAWAALIERMVASITVQP